MAKKVRVTKQNPSGLNIEFYDPSKKKTMRRGEFANEIEKDKYPEYHVMRIKRKSRTERIPRSNPDGNSKNNLG